jgi:hypothetical protein
MVDALSWAVSERVRIQATIIGRPACSMHAHALDPCQGRAANGVRAQECWAVPWISATEHKDEAC